MDGLTGNAEIPGTLQIGALARATGLTVRTLHHYDAIGLLVPDERSYSGRRLYSEPSVRRLYRILALRQLGLSLDEIGAVLDRSPDLAETVRRHLTRVDERLAAQQRLKRTLEQMLALLADEREPDLDQFIQASKEIMMSETYYTPEQLEQLEQRRRAIGAQGIRQAEHAWAELIEAVRAERAAGTPPDDQRMRELAGRWRRLIEQFTGGDEGIRQSLARMYSERGPESASRGMVDPELMEYVGRALAASGPPS